MQLYKNAANCIEQVLEATIHKTAAVRLTKTIQIRQTLHVGHRWKSKDEFISYVLLWTPSHGREKVGRSDRTYLQQICADKGCSLEDLPGAMDDRNGWWKRVWEIHAWHDDDDDDDDIIDININKYMTFLI